MIGVGAGVPVLLLLLLLLTAIPAPLAIGVFGIVCMPLICICDGVGELVTSGDDGRLVTTGDAACDTAVLGSAVVATDCCCCIAGTPGDGGVDCCVR